MKFQLRNEGCGVEDALFSAGRAANGGVLALPSIWRVGLAWSLLMLCGVAAAQADGVAAGPASPSSVLQAHDDAVPSSVAPALAGAQAVNLNPVNAAVTPMRDALQGHARLADAGTAGAMAMAGMPQAYTPGRSMIAAGTAGYEGQSALAVGLSKISENGRWVVKLIGSANSRGNVGVSAGAGFQW